MEQIFQILQIAGGTFPTGAFSQSWGLETYICERKITDEQEFRDFLHFYIGHVLGRFEAPFFCEAYQLAGQKRLKELAELDEQFTAMRLTKEAREATFRTGKAMLRMLTQMLEDEAMTSYYEREKSRGISFPAAFAIAAEKLQISRDAALDAFLFSSVGAMSQSALKLIPLGNVQVQKILLDFYPVMREARETALTIPADEAFVFCPGLDIASSRHETLPTRLYMS